MFPWALTITCVCVCARVCVRVNWYVRIGTWWYMIPCSTWSSPLYTLLLTKVTYKRDLQKKHWYLVVHDSMFHWMLTIIQSVALMESMTIFTHR